MEYTSLIADIRKKLPGLRVKRQEPMRRHCSFQTGGPAAAMAFPDSYEDLVTLCTLLRKKGEKPLVIGNGTNILVPDRGLERFVVVSSPYVGQITVDGTELTADCGVPLFLAASVAADAGLTGLEFAGGIPGTVGGAVIMNAGAYGGELKDVAAQTQYLDENMIPRTAVGAAQGFAYRRSAFSDRDVVVTRTVFSLSPGSERAIRERMQELAARRRASQPLDLPSAGSIFKRPAAGYAAELIDRAGLKGYTVGGAMVSPKHAGFVVNAGNATTDDILRLMEHIQKTVYAAFGVMLEPEVRILDADGLIMSRPNSAQEGQDL